MFPNPPSLPEGAEAQGFNLALLPNFVTWFLLILLLALLWFLLDRQKW